jgi:hypothetical protein
MAGLDRPLHHVRPGDEGGVAEEGDAPYRIVRLAALWWLEPVASCDYAASSAASRQMQKASARVRRWVAAEIR